MNFYGGTTHKEVDFIDQLKLKLQRFLTEHNITALKFAVMAQINPIKIYCWMNDDGYMLDNLSRAQVLSYINQN